MHETRSYDHRRQSSLKSYESPTVLLRVRRTFRCMGVDLSTQFFLFQLRSRPVYNRTLIFRSHRSSRFRSSVSRRSPSRRFSEFQERAAWYHTAIIMALSDADVQKQVRNRIISYSRHISRYSQTGKLREFIFPKKSIRSTDALYWKLTWFFKIEWYLWRNLYF